MPLDPIWSVSSAPEAIEQWRRFRTRGPVYQPGPADYSRPMGSSSEHNDPDFLGWLAVEQAVLRMQPITPRDPRCDILREILMQGPGAINWRKWMLGVPEDVIRYLLGGASLRERAEADFAELIGLIDEQINRINADLRRIAG